MRHPQSLEWALLLQSLRYGVNAAPDGNMRAVFRTVAETLPAPMVLPWLTWVHDNVGVCYLPFDQLLDLVDKQLWHLQKEHP